VTTSNVLFCLTKNQNSKKYSIILDIFLFSVIVTEEGLAGLMSRAGSHLHKVNAIDCNFPPDATEN